MKFQASENFIRKYLFFTVYHFSVNNHHVEYGILKCTCHLYIYSEDKKVKTSTKCFDLTLNLFFIILILIYNLLHFIKSFKKETLQTLITEFLY